jgi:hypothetical protein
MAAQREDLGAKSLGVPNDHSRYATPTPSNLSVTDEKEKEKDVFPEEEDEFENEGRNGEKDLDALARVESSQYPTALKLLGIMVAICLSIFLVALVSIPLPSYCVFHG